MDKSQFGDLIGQLVLTKEMSGSGGPGLRIVDFNGSPYFPISAYNSPDSIVRTRFGIDESVYAKPFDKIVDSVAKAVGYFGDTKEFHASCVKDVNRHCVDLSKYKKQGGVYIRIDHDYNNHGSGKTKTSRKGGTHTTMENRKVKLTLITLLSGATLTLQITGAKKDATAWTNFIDADNSPSEYGDGRVWTKDVASTNQAAVDAVDKMISIETDYAAGKLEKEPALEQFKNAYVEWVIAHLGTNPDFVERQIVGLTVDEPMAAYQNLNTTK